MDKYFEENMKPISLFILILILVVGTYLNQMDPDKDAQVMIEDTVGSSMAAPIKTK